MLMLKIVLLVCFIYIVLLLIHFTPLCIIEIDTCFRYLSIRYGFKVYILTIKYTY